MTFNMTNMCTITTTLINETRLRHFIFNRDVIDLEAGPLDKEVQNRMKKLLFNKKSSPFRVESVEMKGVVMLHARPKSIRTHGHSETNSMMVKAEFLEELKEMVMGMEKTLVASTAEVYEEEEHEEKEVKKPKKKAPKPTTDAVNIEPEPRKIIEGESSICPQCLATCNKCNSIKEQLKESTRTIRQTNKKQKAKDKELEETKIKLIEVEEEREQRVRAHQDKMEALRKQIEELRAATLKAN